MRLREQAPTFRTFCYHKKLSIAANCRMCLVDVEKAPKPMPACATPGHARHGARCAPRATRPSRPSSRSVEFPAHQPPLDCPICDQGGECQLQDLAVGYGGTSSRYEEEKRVVFHRRLGTAASMEEMTLCIHCTRRACASAKKSPW